MFWSLELSHQPAIYAKFNDEDLKYRYSKKIMIDIKSIEEFVDKDGYDIETTN